MEIIALAEFNKDSFKLFLQIFLYFSIPMIKLVRSHVHFKVRIG